MPNSASQLHEKLYEDYEDSLFRLVMHDVAETEGSLYLEENEKLKKDPEFLPSEAAALTFEKQLSAYLKKKRANSGKRILYKTVNRAAAAVLAVTITFSVAMLSVQAFRVRVFNLLIDMEDKYTSFQLREDNPDDGEDLTINWTDAYIPTYIPDGYEISDVTNLSSIKGITYNNAEGNVILYKEFSSNTNVAVDSEDASRVETIEINGRTGTLIVKNSLVSVVWEMDGKLFLIQADTSVDETVKIAEGIKFAD